MPRHTLEDMLRYVTEPSKFLTEEANEELTSARRAILEEFNRQREAFIKEHSQLPGAGELFDLVSPLKTPMPGRQAWSDCGYHVKYGMLFGMIIGQLNWCLETGRPAAASRAAIDYVRHYARQFDEMRFT